MTLDTMRQSASLLYESAVQQGTIEQQPTASAPADAPPKLSKRTNARLQLAAALIEADNERIYERAEYWHLSHPDQRDNDIRPPPPPQPALASQSVIFAPYRDDAGPSITRHVRTWSSATGLSQLVGPEGQRASIDYLGIAMPSENKQRTLAGSKDGHSRADSLLSLAPSKSSIATNRSTSLLQLEGNDSTLTDWGIDKFLSKEERERTAQTQRSRAASLVDRRYSCGSRNSDTRKAASDIISTTPSSKIDLLAKIKLYRERQENMPPVHWEGPGPQATTDQVLDHLQHNVTDAQLNSTTPQTSADHKLIKDADEQIAQDATRVCDFFGPDVARTLRKNAFTLATAQQLDQSSANNDTAASEAQNHMEGTGSYSRSQRTSVMSPPVHPQREFGRNLSTDIFHQTEVGIGSGPFAAVSQGHSPLVASEDLPSNDRSTAFDTANLTTKQLQTMARNLTFPSYLGINRDLLDDAESEIEEDEFGQLPKKPKRLSVTALLDDLSRTGGANFDIRMSEDAPPDLSSANWGKPRKKWFRLSTMADVKSKKAHQRGQDSDTDARAQDVDTAQAALDIDDDYTSPPTKGPLRPLGLSARLPKTIVMPGRLEGTPLAPQSILAAEAQPNNRHSLHVPDGFVLHNSRGGLPPMRSLVVQSASGPQALFAAKKSKKHRQIVADVKALQVDRTVQVPVAAPRGIGRRAAVPTTALFRNHLVQNDDEREGWGWEAGTRASDTLYPDVVIDSDDDDQPLADLRKQSRSAKKAAKKVAKEKRKRKMARRVRRAKREEGDNTIESPDEDLDLSSTSSEDDLSDSDAWENDEDERWVDDHKPAGKLYGKSLLDIATERTIERKSKARFYGQVQLEDEEPTMCQLDENQTAGRDDASVAPSVATSFRDKPLGYNDTRERMEAVFGADELWAREMAKRKEEEALEAARAETMQTEPKPRKSGLFVRRKKSSVARSDDEVDGSTVNNARSESYTSAQPQEVSKTDESAIKAAPPPILALDVDIPTSISGRTSAPALLSGEDKAIDEWLIKSGHNSAQEDSDDEDNIPLSQIKKKTIPRPSSFAAGLGTGTALSADLSSDEEMPLAALKDKRARQSMVFGSGALSIELLRNNNVKAGPPAVIMSSVRSPLGNMRLNGQAQSQTMTMEKQGTSDSEDDVPLVHRHPQANTALAAIRAGLERKNAAAREGRRLTKLTEKLAAQRAGNDSDESEHESDDSEDDRPLGYTHPQAAIIAEQAALIRQLQADSSKSSMTTAQRPTSMFGLNDPRQSRMSFSGWPQYDGLPFTSAGLPMQIQMPMTGPAHLPPSAMAFSPGISLHSQAVHMQSPAVSTQSLFDPVASSIHNWRAQVPPDATSAVTPSAGTSGTDP